MKTFSPLGKFDESLVKLVVPIDGKDWHGFGEEVMWGKALGGDHYELQNTPFFAKGLSYLDIVSAISKDGRLFITGTVRPSRRSTYRVLIEDSTPPQSVEKALEEMIRLGCTYEDYHGNRWTLRALDVPSEAVDAVYGLLQAGADSDIWDFDEGHFGGRQQ